MIDIALLFLKITLLLTAVLLATRLIALTNPRWKILICETGAVASLFLCTLVWFPWTLAIPVFPETSSLSSLPVMEPTLSGDSSMPSFAESLSQTREGGKIAGNAAAWRLSMPGVIGVIYAVGVIVLFVRQLKSQRQLRAALKQLPVADDSARGILARLAEEIGAHTPLLLLVSREPISPLAAYGPAGATIVIPAKLLELDEAPVLELVLRHELHHLENSDLLREQLMMWIVSLIWIHPFIWLIQREHSAAIEELGDRIAARKSGNKTYAAALARFALLLQPGRAHGAAISWFGKPLILRRLKRLECDSPHNRISRLAGGLAVGGILLTVFMIGVLRAQEKTVPNSNALVNVLLDSQKLDVKQSVRRATAFLVAQQLEDGSFPQTATSDKKSEGTITGY